MEPASRTSPPIRRWLFLSLLCGCYLTFRGYHSLDGDQAYRLPLLLHQQQPALYGDDPFVNALASFNPHKGYLALLDATDRLFGLSAALLGLFLLTFGLTCAAIDRLARAVWPESGEQVGLAAVILVLLAEAGNIGTNHLFEPMLLDRLVALSLGWNALALILAKADGACWRPPLLLGVAGLIHPALGLQLSVLVVAAWWLWALTGRSSEVRARDAALASVMAGSPWFRP